MKIGNKDYVSKHTQGIFARFISGEWGEWKAFAELMIDSTNEMGHWPHVSTDRTIWAAKMMERLKKEKESLEGGKDERTK